jgi:PAS domain S-box-containing protein
MEDLKKINKLRAEAEKIFRSNHADINIDDYKNNVLGLVEELSIYQIELELQNEELRSKQLELANEKQRFEDLYLNAPIGYFLFDEKGIILDLNRKANNILGTHSSIAKDQPFIAFLGDGSASAVFMKHLKDVFDNPDNTEKEIELIIPNSNKEVRFIRLTSNILHEKYCRSLAEDITEKRQSQLKMEMLSNRLQAAMSAGDMAWWELELPSGNVYFHSNKAIMLGYDPDDFKNYNDFMDLVHPDDYERTMEAFRKHLNGFKDVYDTEYRIKDAFGNYLWFHDIGRIINRNIDGIKLTGIVTNITLQKKSEIELQQSEKKLKTIIKTLPDLLFHFDKEGRFLSFYQDSPILFKKPEEFLNKSIYDIFDKKTAEDFQKCIDYTLLHGSHEYNYDLFIDETKHFQAKYSKLSDNEIVALVRDVTEQKKAQNIITSQNEKLKELNATKDKFFSIIAHDLKNPFNSILNYSELLIDYHTCYNEEKTSEMIKSIRNSAKHTYKLLENLLTWSRAQTGRIVYNTEIFNLQALVKDSIQLLEQNAISKNLKVSNRIDENLYAKGDINTIGTVIRNLLSNAYKFTPKNKSVWVEAKEIEKNNTKYVRVCVCDSGVGIPEDRSSKLFDIGSSSSTKGTENEAGTGLGLILCKEFVEKNGGELWVESRLNEGSKFYFTLPYAEASEKDKTAFLIPDNSSITEIKMAISGLSDDTSNLIMQQLLERYTLVRKTSSLESIKALSDSFVFFGEKHDISKLKEIGISIKDLLKEFDIASINETIKILNLLFDE